MDDRSPPRAQRPLPFHIPPEEAVALALVLLEMGAQSWTRRRNAFSLQMSGIRRNIELSLTHERPLRVFLRESHIFPRRGR